MYSKHNKKMNDQKQLEKVKAVSRFLCKHNLML